MTLGLLQYLAPMLQFALGVFWFHEAMPAGRWIGFGLVWVALVDLHRRGAAAPTPPPAPARRVDGPGLAGQADRVATTSANASSAARTGPSGSTSRGPWPPAPGRRRSRGPRSMAGCARSRASASACAVVVGEVGRRAARAGGRRPGRWRPAGHQDRQRGHALAQVGAGRLARRRRTRRRCRGCRRRAGRRSRRSRRTP